MTIDYSQLMEAEKQVEMLFKEKGKELIFHNFARAESMVETISHLFKLDSTLREKVEDLKETENVLKTLALFSETGYTMGQDMKCLGSGAIASEILPKCGYPEEQVNYIKCLLGDAAFFNPRSCSESTEEHILTTLYDTKTRYFADETFFLLSMQHRQELQKDGQNIPLRDWYANELNRLESHWYCTIPAMMAYSEKKRNNVKELKLLLGYV
ncbi:hypothetical protein HOA91_03045 [Candidatus Woesearchaeota archaeon]|jgi:hypothetical protein|nr:hypothetical protein [Candidatus Woesearchaeota archaeon]